VPPNHPPTTSSIQVPPPVFEDILAVRDSGAIDMLDAHHVAAVLDALGMPASAAWIRHNLASYMRAVRLGTGEDTQTPAKPPKSGLTLLAAPDGSEACLAAQRR
jgi:hypothetical protein